MRVFRKKLEPKCPLVVTIRGYREGMNTNVIEVTDEELTLLVAALRSYLSDFGHDEADVQRAIKHLLAKMPQLRRSA
ncbi:MAG: hypothetical protein ACRDSE_22590 [Pseudonocardiaceae bacterium]